MNEPQVDNILLIEDDENDAELIRNGLEEYNLINKVHHVKDGEEALNYLFQTGEYEGSDYGIPSLIMLDLKMPKVDGLTVLEKIKSDDELKFIPVVALTSSREEKDLHRAYDLGVNAYVVKPIDFGQFIEAIRTLGGFWAFYNTAPRRKK